MKLEFFYKFSKNTPTSNFMKIRRVEAKMFHANVQMDRRTDGRTDEQTNMTNIKLACRKIANALKNQLANTVHENIAVFLEIHTKHISTLCGQDAEFFKFKPAAA